MRERSVHDWLALAALWAQAAYGAVFAVFLVGHLLARTGEDEYGTAVALVLMATGELLLAPVAIVAANHLLHRMRGR